MDWGFPQNVSTLGDRIDATYGAIFIATALAFLIVEGLLIYCIIRFRHREGRKSLPIHGNTRLEVVWTIVPAVGVFFLAFVSASVWLDAKQAERIPSGAYEVRIDARQFEWNVTNSGLDGQLGTADDFPTRNQLYIPVNRPIRVTLAADDVIHSFFLPNFRVKQDAVPGMEIPVWFEAMEVGEYPLGCAELCGLGHYRMRGTVTVLSAEEFEEWQATEGAIAAGSDEPTTVAAR